MEELKKKKKLKKKEKIHDLFVFEEDRRIIKNLTANVSEGEIRRGSGDPRSSSDESNNSDFSWQVARKKN